MKVTIDYENKTIQFHNRISIAELKKWIKDHKEFEDFDVIQTVEYTYYPYPIYPVYPTYPTYPTNPYDYPIITCETTSQSWEVESNDDVKINYSLTEPNVCN